MRHSVYGPVTTCAAPAHCSPPNKSALSTVSWTNYFPAAENDRPNDCLIGLICYLSYTAADCPAREKCQHEELPRWKEKFQAVPSLGLDSEL